jgi:hypothetical protein
MFSFQKHMPSVPLVRIAGPGGKTSRETLGSWSRYINWTAGP